jgi:hypothetical protein
MRQLSSGKIGLIMPLAISFQFNSPSSFSFCSTNGSLFSISNAIHVVPKLGLKMPTHALFHSDSSNRTKISNERVTFS